MTDKPSEIVCNLTEPKLRDRKDDFRTKLTPYLTKATYAKGTSRLVFSKPEVTRDMLKQLMVLESKCCPFFSFDLTETDNHFQLSVTGPEGSEDMVQDFFCPSGETGCGCSAQTTTTSSKRPKYIAGVVSLCMIACAIPPVLAAFGLVSVATGAWFGRGIEVVITSLALFGFAYFLLQYARTRRRKA